MDVAVDNVTYNGFDDMLVKNELPSEKSPFCSYLERINEPGDIKNLSFRELALLADEIREFILDTVSRTGGHLASNLGAVELTLALHYVFDSPRDAIIWDVGHQCYTHKLITGRRERFATLRQKGGLSGFPRPEESPHDIVETGHASTSISSGLGLLVGREILDIKGHVIAVIGDGALTGGLALEALNHAGHLKKNLIIILNDNDMSISPNVGAISYYISRLSTSSSYQGVRDRIDSLIKSIPHYGDSALKLVERFKAAVKSVVYEENLFSHLGFEYVGPVDGHDIERLVSNFLRVKELSKPVVVHVKTQKGKGYHHSESNPTSYHGVGPFSIETGSSGSSSASPSFTSAFSASLIKYAEVDNKITAITAAMETGTGLSSFKERFPDRFFDVGIAEQHALTFASGLARAGLKPVVAIYATFLQRALDQLIHDIALPGLPVVLAVDRAGLVPGDGDTHQGIYDLAMLRAVPSLSVLMPSTSCEMNMMLGWALSADSPVVIRYPKDTCLSEDGAFISPLEKGRGIFVRKTGSADRLIIGYGGHIRECIKAAELAEKQGIKCDVYSLRFLKPLDIDYLSAVCKPYKKIIIAEDIAASGGVGSLIKSELADTTDAVITLRAVSDEFPQHATREELLASYGLDAKSLVKLI
ncbi:1-deoxy-D-xylulose-5-phosphate synthase [Spirochaetia bacterium 38H-sp]|uniref:1-deoxy-D-xylulose-5-phosphate synthase n=1 Tax=Rarispira pelagica TaxID=3141764 RepID=A0ABU9UAC9_9SPIR